MSKWKPMARAKSLPLHPTRRAALTRWAHDLGHSPAAVEKLIAEAEGAETWMNDRYVATIHPTAAWQDGWPNMAQLSIRRIDRKPIHDWRHLQQIKTDIYGPSVEAVELYPNEKRVVDTANSFHLFVLTDPGSMFPFGWQDGLRTDDDAAAIANQQRRGSAR